MKKGSIPLLVLLLLTQTLSAQDDGFQGIPWGSPPSTVMDIFGYPDENRRNEPEGFSRTLVYNDAELLGYKKFIVLLFYFEGDLGEERLALVVYWLFDCPASRDLYNMLENGLTFKYGEGQQFEKCKLWYVTNNTSIELIYDNGLLLRYSDVPAARRRMQQLWERL